MADLRIKVAKDKAKLVKALKAGENATGLFQTYYEILVFAAALGAKRDKMMPLKDISKEIDPIRQEQFASKGYDQIIKILAVNHTKDPKILSSTEDAEQRRVEVFEAYANGGLSLLQDILKGSDDYSKQIFLLLATERDNLENPENEFSDLTFL